MYFLHYTLICLIFILLCQLVSCTNSLLNLIILAETLVVLFFCLFVVVAVIYNISLNIGFGLCFLVISSLEVALAFLILAL